MLGPNFIIIFLFVIVKIIVNYIILLSLSSLHPLLCQKPACHLLIPKKASFQGGGFNVT